MVNRNSLSRCRSKKLQIQHDVKHMERFKAASAAVSGRRAYNKQKRDSQLESRPNSDQSGPIQTASGRKFFSRGESRELCILFKRVYCFTILIWSLFYLQIVQVHFFYFLSFFISSLFFFFFLLLTKKSYLIFYFFTLHNWSLFFFFFFVKVKIFLKKEIVLKGNFYHQYRGAFPLY